MGCTRTSAFLYRPGFGAEEVTPKIIATGNLECFVLRFVGDSNVVIAWARQQRSVSRRLACAVVSMADNILLNGSPNPTCSGQSRQPVLEVAAPRDVRNVDALLISVAGGDASGEGVGVRACEVATEIVAVALDGKGARSTGEGLPIICRAARGLSWG